MKQLRDAIRYRFESLPDGGRIRITATGAAATSAVHDFLRFQIAEHHTDDKGEIEIDQQRPESRLTDPADPSDRSARTPAAE